MNEPVWAMLGAIVVAIIAAVQSARSGAKDRPIKKKEVDAVALSSAAGVDGAYGELFDNLQKEVARQAAQLDKLNGRVDHLEGALAEERRINRILRAWIENVVARWEHYRQSETPLTPPNV